jgi:hypothetical protein
LRIIKRYHEWRHKNGSTYLGVTFSLLPMPSVSAWYQRTFTRHGPFSLVFNRFIVPSLLLVLLIKWLWPALIPFELFEFWFLRGSSGEVIGTAWPILAWSGAMALLANLTLLFIHAIYQELAEPTEIWESPFPTDLYREAVPNLISRSWWLPLKVLQEVWNGIIEELALRWCVFYALMVLLISVDFLLLGFVNIHILQFIYLHIAGPIVDFLTFGHLHNLLFNGHWGWVVGAAIVLIPNRQTATYQLSFSGVLRYLRVAFVVTWLVSRLFFVVMFQYGLYAAIIVSCIDKVFSVFFFSLIHYILFRTNVGETLRRVWPQRSWL